MPDEEPTTHNKPIISVDRSKASAGWEVKLTFPNAGTYTKLFNNFDKAYQFANNLRSTKLTVEDKARFIEKLGMRRLV